MKASQKRPKFKKAVLNRTAYHFLLALKFVVLFLQVSPVRLEPGAHLETMKRVVTKFLKSFVVNKLLTGLTEYETKTRYITKFIFPGEIQSSFQNKKLMIKIPIDRVNTHGLLKIFVNGPLNGTPYYWQVLPIHQSTS